MYGQERTFTRPKRRINSFSRVTFKAQLKVGWGQSTTLNVIYKIVCHTLELMNRPRYSGRCWCGLRNPRWRPSWPLEINARGCCICITATELMYINSSN